MGPVGPTSEKAAIHMKNRVILVAKHCKKKKKRERSEKEGITVSFFPSVWLVFFFITPWALKLLEIASYKGKKKKHKEAEKNPPFLRLDFLSFATYYFLPIIDRKSVV